jgi:Amt family ammonium transporter
MAIDTGDTAWMLISTALVLLMTPGLAFFYGGQVRARSALNMMMMSFVSMGIVVILWVIYGYSMTFGRDLGSGLLGDPTEFFGLEALLSESAVFGTVPGIVFAGFQAMFAVITVALVSGAVADRMKFGAWVLFAALWVSLVYFPVAHWVFDFDGGESDPGGWIANDLAAIDFAGGTAVHINAGVAALAVVLVLGRRVGFGAQPFKPHNLTMVMLGAALLWFGWFGFNAGSAIGSNNLAGVTFFNTIVATGAGMLAWLLVEKIRDGHSTTLGAASGIVAGLVAITPACSSVTPIGAILVGAISSTLAAYAVGFKYKFGYDDALDVVGVHFVAGLAGSLLVGVFASSAAPAGVDGLLYGGGADQLIKQAIACFAVILYSFIVTFLLAKILDKVIGLRADKEDEISGVDLAFHAESAYELGGAFKGGR